MLESIVECVDLITYNLQLLILDFYSIHSNLMWCCMRCWYFVLLIDLKIPLFCYVTLNILLMFHPIILLFFSLFHSIFISSPPFNYGASSSLKGFCDLGLHMNLWVRFILFSFLAFQLLDWLHDDYIGNHNRFDLISKFWDLSISYRATWFTS